MEQNQHDHHSHVKAHQSMGHSGHDHNKMIVDFRNRFFVVLVLTIPILLLSEMIQRWMGIHWPFPVRDMFCLPYQPSFSYMAAIHSFRAYFMN